MLAADGGLCRIVHGLRSCNRRAGHRNFRRGLRLCIIVQILRMVEDVRFRVVDDLDLFDFEGDLLLGLRGCGDDLQDGERGSEANRGGGLRIGEDLPDVVDGEVGEGFGFFAEEQSAVVLGVREGVLEGEGVAAPVSDGVAVNAGLFGGVGSGGAVRQGADDGELLRSQSVIGHRNHFLISR